MKRILGLLCLLSAAACLAQSANLIANPGLEGAVGGNGLPEGWAIFSNPADAYKATVEPGGRSGEKSLLLTGDGQFGVVGVHRVPIEAGKQYALRGWAKLEGDANTMGTIKFDYFKDNGDYVDSDTVGVIKIAQTGWQPIAVTSREKAPEGATRIGAALAMNGKGKAWFDDLEFITRPAPTAGNLAANGDFERLVGPQLQGIYLGTSEGGQMKAVPSTEDPKDGWHCLRLHGKTEWAVAAIPRIPFEAGKTYTLTGQVRVKQGIGQIKIDYFKDDQYLGQTFSNDVTENQWTSRRVFSERDKYPTATHIAATAVGLGEVDAYFDSLSLTAK